MNQANKLQFELTEAQLNNLSVFLDRVTFTGFQEHQALSELLQVLNNPINKKQQPVQTQKAPKP